MSRAPIRSLALRATRSLLVAALALAGLTCRDNSPLGPGLPTRTSLALVPHFETVAGGPVVQLDRARVQIFRMPVEVGEQAIVDTTAQFVANDALTLDITVPILGASNDFLYRITAMDAAGNVIYAATDSVTVVAGAAPQEPEIATLHWATADTLVRAIDVQPRDTVLTANEPFTFRMTAKKADSSVVTAAVGWVSRDESQLHMDQATGTATALTQFSNVWIVATTGTGVKDSTLVSATQPVASVVVSPNSATLFVGGTQQLNASVSAAGGVPLPTRPLFWQSNNTAVATVSSNGLVTAVSIGSAQISVTSGGVTATSAITVARKVPVITWPAPADITYGTPLSATQLNANAVFNSASVQGTFAYLPPAGTVLNAGNALPLNVAFTPTDGAVFAGASGATTINVVKAGQTITFAVIPDHVFGDADFTVSATASSGLAVTFAASGACTVTGATVQLTGSGSCTITASQPGDANRNAATDVSRTFNVNKAALTIVAASASGVFNGNASLSATVTAGGAPLAGKLVAFSLNGVSIGSSTTTASGVATVSASLAGINAGTYAGALSPASGVLASFVGDANFNAAQSVSTLIVTQATATLALGQLNFIFDSTPKPVSVTTTPAGLTGVTVTYNGVATAPTAAGSYAVVASLANQNYQAASASGTLVIGQAGQTITFSPLPPRTLGDAAFTVSATSTSGLPVTFDASGSCTVAGDQVSLTAEGTCTITASQVGNVNYSAAPSVSQSFNVGPRPVASVTINPMSALVQVGQTVLFNATITAANGEVLVRPITWTTGNSGIATVDNGIVTGVTVGQTTVTATVEGKSATATVDVQPPPNVVDSIAIASVDGDTLFSIGARRLLAVNAYSGTAIVAGLYTWQSSDTQVLTVDAFGTVTAIANGTATITATEKGGKTDAIAIAVVQKLARMAISPSYMLLAPADTGKFTVSGYDALNNPMTLSDQVRWHIAGYYGYATVSLDSITGDVRATGLGNSTILATSGNLEARALVEVETRVRTVQVTGNGRFNGLGFPQSYTATALDADGKPVTPVDVSWESLNESVVRPTSFDGNTMSATSYTNGSATLRATIDGVHGDLSVVVAQELKNIVVYPSVVNIDIGGVAVLTAEGRDVNNHTMVLAPGSISWTSQDEAVVKVDPVSGVVTGVGRGSSAVTAVAGQGGLIPSTAANVTVASVAPAVSFGANLLSVGKGERLPITLYLNQAAKSTIALNLSGGGSYATWAASSVTFGIGDSVKVVEILGVQAGTTTISASNDGGVGSTVTLAVQPVASLPDVGGDQMNAGEELATKVYLNDPAPAGGSWVTFSFAVPGVVSVFPERAFIPAGQLAADVVIRAIAGGSTSVLPMVPGVTGRSTPDIYVYDAVIGVNMPQTPRLIGAGQFEFGPGQGGYQGGYGMTMRQRAAKSIQQAGRPASESISGRVAVRIPTAGGQWADGYYYYGSCSGFLGEVILTDGYNYGYGLPQPDYCLTVGTAPEPPITAQLTSSNSNVLLVENAVELSFYTAGFSVAAVSPGTATVTASATGWTPGAIPVVVTTPRLNVIGGYGDGFEFGDSVTLRDVGYATYYLEVGDSTGAPHPLINSLRIRLTSSDPSVFTISDSVKVFDAGSSSTYVNLSLSAVGTGSAWLRFHSDGHFGDSIYVTVPKRGLLVPRVLTIGAGQKEVLSITTKRPEADTTLRVSVMSLTDTTSASIDSGAAFAYSYAYVNVRGYQPGSTDFVLTSAGFDPETVTVVVTKPRLRLNYEVLQQAIGSTATLAVYLDDSLGNSHPPIDTVIVSLRSLDTLIATVTPMASVDYNYNQGIQLSPQAIGSTKIIAEAPGYVSDTMDVEIFRTPVSFSYSDMVVGVGARQQTWYNVEPFITIPNYVVDAADSVVLRIRHQTNGRTTLDASRLVVYQNYQQTSRFTVVGESVGVDTLIVEDSTGRYAPDTMYVTVVPSRISINNDSAVVSVANPSGLPNQLQLADANGTWVAFGKPVTLYVTSSNPGVVAVNDSIIMVGNGEMSRNFGLTAVGAGTADITISDSTGQIGSRTVHITVTGVRLRPSMPLTTVGMRQRSNDAYVWIESTDSSQVVVTLTSSDPNIASVPDTVILAPYNNIAYFPIIGHDTLGTVRITMVAPGFEPTYMDVDVGRPRIMVFGSGNGSANSSQQMEVFAVDQSGYRRYPVEPVTVTLISSNPGVAGSDTALYTIPASDCQYEACPPGPNMHYLMPGSTVFTARDARYPSLIAYKPFVDTITVSKPHLYPEPINYWYGLYVGPTQQDSLRVTLQATALTAVTVTFTSSRPDVVEVPDTITIPAGANGIYVPVYGRSLLADGAFISATATGYSGGTMFVSARRGSVELYTPSTFTAGQPTVVSLRTRDPNEQVYNGFSAVTSQQSFTLTGDTAVVKFYAMDGTRITAVTVDSGSYQVQYKVVPQNGGSITFGTTGNANFTDGSAAYQAYYASSAAVAITDVAFTPSNVDIAANANVTWTNNGSTAHNVTWTSTSPTPPLSSANLSVGQTVTRSFVAPGTYTYRCSIHPTMTGTVVAH